MDHTVLIESALRGLEILSEEDPILYELLEREYHRQTNTLAMVAASSVADPSVLVCEGMVTANLTTEGYPGKRFHAGCEYVDQIERLAIERARKAFQACYANVQPHSGSSANQIVMFSLLQPGDTVLGLDLRCGGHLTHGAKASVSGRYFNAVGYGLDPDGLIDYEQVYRLAMEHQPRLIVTGASAYPRIIDFRKFRTIADAAGAWLLADISHIAGLVAAGEHPSPIDQAHFTTTSTYKQLGGPRGGLILMGKDYGRIAPDGKRTLAELIQNAVFPFFQGTPNLSAIAAKARALANVLTPEFKAMAHRIVSSARELARCMVETGYRVLTGGTDNHLMLIDLEAEGLTGRIAERALEECQIIVNKNMIPGDKKSPQITSGLRLGTNSLAIRGMTTREMPQCASLVDRVLRSLKPLSDSQYELCPAVKAAVQEEVSQLCRRFPLPNYPWEVGALSRPSQARPRDEMEAPPMVEMVPAGPRRDTIHSGEMR
jgi:glycine hydroxymethyltransferase